jgi:hypothetical protein
MCNLARSGAARRLVSTGLGSGSQNKQRLEFACAVFQYVATRCLGIALLHDTTTVLTSRQYLHYTAAARRDREKRRTYGQLEPNGYPFIPFSLGKPAISFLGQLGLEAKEAGRKVSKSGFVASAIREISVGLCRGDYQMYRASLGLLVGVSGRGFREGAAHPTEEVL